MSEDSMTRLRRISARVVTLAAAALALGAFAAPYVAH